MAFKLFNQKFIDDGVETGTGIAQKLVERDITNDHLETDQFLKSSHVKYASRKVNYLSTNMNDEMFKPWYPFYYFFPLLFAEDTQSIDLEKYKTQSIEFLKNHTNIHCGWSGYLQDHPSLVPLYGCTIFLGLIGKEEGYDIVDRQSFYKYIMSCKNPNGSFSTSPLGETDLRSTFSAIFISWMYNILTPELTEGVVDFVKRCQNYDGGFSPLPDCEAHGGYTYCAIGILTILNKMEEVDIHKCARWIADRQMPFSGGFNGRTHKLVDTCYCWWVGSPARMISNYLNITPFWNDVAISEYIIKVAQSDNGGLRDRPPHYPDPFHTLWGCAGLCVCGNHEMKGLETIPEVNAVSTIPVELFEKMKKYFENKGTFIPE